MTQHWPGEVSALESARLPRFTFIDDDGKEETVALSSQTARIRAVARHLGAKAEPGTVTGLVYRSGQELVTNWLACLVAGLRPLIMQYPTRKQSRAYWSDSIRNTIEVAGVGAIVSDAHCAEILRESGVAVTIVSEDELTDARAEDTSAFSITDFAIIQLSSGTTGHRKAIEFDARQLFAHVRDYNAALILGPQDRIASWLPLYHDMGYIACFVMPMLLGIDVVMMDPIGWVRNPVFLYDAIERHTATICYMPNFGFEVMARLEPRRLLSMRWWISCSEPVSPQTARKFIEVNGADPQSFAPCYAMAENVFAVSLRRGLATREIDGVEVASCGKAVANVDMKVIDEQIWVKSPASLVSYMGGSDIRDVEGFYPTGDLGQIIDGEVFVTGRKQDLVIQAGRKYMLSDIDLALNQLFPWIKGRAAAVQVYDERLGTQKPQVLIESEDFFLRSDQPEIATALREATNLDHVGVEFVPPRFLTKTSSGKFNRKKSAADWLVAKQARQSRASRADPLNELRQSFPHVDWEKPVEEILDSLSLELLRIILTGTGVAYEGTRTLSEFGASLTALKAAPEAEAPDTIRIVSLADRHNVSNLGDDDIDRISRRLGMPVTFEHVCLPPSPIILSDLIFHDWFQPRAQSGDFTAIDRALETLKSASLILVDDAAEMLIGTGQTPGALSHNLERDPTCDLISYRWQRYAQHHDTLPMTFVAGVDLAFEDRTKVIDMLSAYLGTPIFKIAVVHGFEAFTEEWDYRAGNAGGKSQRRVDPGTFVRALLKWVKRRGEPLKAHPSRETQKIQINDLGHFCAHLVVEDAVKTVASKFDSFCIAGRPSSVPYLRKELDRLGKPYVYAASYSQEVLANVPQDYDCIVICGPQGEYPLAKPTVALMRASKKWRVTNIDDDEIQDLQLNPRVKDYPATGTDWFYPFPLDRKNNAEHHRAALDINKPAKRAEAAARLKGKEERRARRANKEQSQAETGTKSAARRRRAKKGGEEE
jgi:acyl-CoA synthetase (AMP-forming)/AMP-acid ligase II